jgi:tetratricopeptide (TPR) repeat protein
MSAEVDSDAEEDEWEKRQSYEREVASMDGESIQREQDLAAERLRVEQEFFESLFVPGLKHKAYKYAEELIQKEQYSKATWALKKLLPLYRSDQEKTVKIRLGLSTMYVKNYQWREAIESCNHALMMQPQHVKLLCLKAQAHRALKQFDEAMDALNDAAAAVRLSGSTVRDPEVHRLQLYVQKDVAKQAESRREEGAILERAKQSAVLEAREAARKALARQRGVAITSVGAAAASASGGGGGGRGADGEAADITFRVDAPLGLTLRDTGDGRVVVSSIKAGGQAAALGGVAIGQIVLAVEGEVTRRESASQVQGRISKAKQAKPAGSITLTLDRPPEPSADASAAARAAFAASSPRPLSDGDSKGEGAVGGGGGGATPDVSDSTYNVAGPAVGKGLKRTRDYSEWLFKELQRCIADHEARLMFYEEDGWMAIEDGELGMPRESQAVDASVVTDADGTSTLYYDISVNAQGRCVQCRGEAKDYGVMHFQCRILLRCDNSSDESPDSWDVEAKTIGLQFKETGRVKKMMDGYVRPKYIPYFKDIVKGCIQRLKTKVLQEG